MWALPSSATHGSIVLVVPREEPVPTAPVLGCMGPLFVALLSVPFGSPPAPIWVLLIVVRSSQVKSVEALAAGRRTRHLLNRVWRERKRAKESMLYPPC